MRFWFAAGSEVPIYKQLATQVTLAILSGELKPGDRLPSTREMARRFALHPNTISAGYKRLEQEGWTERRQGSGVYVRSHREAPRTAEEVLDRHIAGFFKAVRELKLPEDAVRTRVQQWLDAPRADHFLVIDPDERMREILIAEITRISAFPVRGVGVEECRSREVLATAIPLCRPTKTKLVRGLLPPGVELMTLPIRSANAWLTPWLPLAGGALVGIVSHWPEFLEVARTMLIAAGLAPEALVFRDAGKAGWQRGLEGMTAILCDAHTRAVATLPSKPRIIVFSVIADEGKAEIARLGQSR